MIPSTYALRLVFFARHLLARIMNRENSLNAIRPRSVLCQGVCYPTIGSVPAKTAEHGGDELADVLMSRYEKLSSVIASNRAVDDWWKLLGDVVVVTPRLDRIMPRDHLLKFEGKSVVISSVNRPS